MVVRIWRTGVHSSDVAEYERFAAEESLPMFRRQAGFLGVIFARSGAGCSVITLWQDHESVEALATSATYAETVARIVATGVLCGEQSVEVLEAHGGDLTSA